MSISYDSEAENKWYNNSLQPNQQHFILMKSGNLLVTGPHALKARAIKEGNKTNYLVKTYNKTDFIYIRIIFTYSKFFNIIFSHMFYKFINCIFCSRWIKFNIFKYFNSYGFNTFCSSTNHHSYQMCRSHTKHSRKLF